MESRDSTERGYKNRKCNQQWSRNKWGKWRYFILGPYSYRYIHEKKSSESQQRGRKTANNNTVQCYNCGNNVKGSIIKRTSSCPAHNSKCYNCQLTGHFCKLCESKDI